MRRILLSSLCLGLHFLRGISAFLVVRSNTPSRTTQYYYNARSTTSSSTQCNAYKHILAILSMPVTSLDRMANEAVIETALPETQKLSIVLRCGRDGTRPTTSALRRYVGEIYSQLWDCALNLEEGPTPSSAGVMLPDVVVYPQNLPNAAPESWIDIQPDLDGVCSHDEIVGWSSVRSRLCNNDSESSSVSTSTTNGQQRRRNVDYTKDAGNGVGGLDEHVANVNSERRQRKLPPVTALHVPHFGIVERAARDRQVVFLDDDDNEASTDDDAEDEEACDVSDDNNNNEPGLFLSGAAGTPHLYDSVCVGGTFDGLHFGHRKLLTLAASSVHPVTGRLLVGVTVDEMLRHKALAELIPPLEERCRGVRDFLHRLAPGMKNRLSIVPIEDSFGPPGQANRQFDALVLSHETLETGYLLNQHRQSQLHLPPLKLLCTRRTEAHGMSSTALRRLRRNRQQLEEQALQQQEQQQQSR